MFRLAVGPPQCLTQWILGVLSLEVMQRRSDTSDCHPSMCQGQERTELHFHSLSALIVWRFIKDRGNFPFSGMLLDMTV
jgi:hypothetical protein